MTDKRNFVLYTLRYLLAHEIPTNINTRTYEGIESMIGSFYLKGFKYWFEFWKNKLTLSATTINENEATNIFTKWVVDDLTDAEICNFKVDFYKALDNFDKKCIEMFDLHNTYKGNPGTVPTDARIQQDKTALDSMDNLV